MQTPPIFDISVFLSHWRLGRFFSGLSSFSVCFLLECTDAETSALRRLSWSDFIWKASNILCTKTGSPCNKRQLPLHNKRSKPFDLMHRHTSTVNDAIICRKRRSVTAEDIWRAAAEVLCFPPTWQLGWWQSHTLTGSTSSDRHVREARMLGEMLAPSVAKMSPSPTKACSWHVVRS